MNIFNKPIGLNLSQSLTGKIAKIINIKIIQPQILLVIFAAFILSGCVQYDLGIKFNHTNNGELLQHIKISESLTGFSGDYVAEWLKTIERRTKKLQGSVQHISPEETIIKIPFTNSAELQDKFSGFFNYGNDKKIDKSENTNKKTQIYSHLVAEENNFLLLSRHHLIYDLDLTSLAALTSKNNLLSTSDTILNLDFGLQTPWGVNNIQKNENTAKPEKNGNQVLWRLKLGKLNHIEAVFWLPNMLGIGTLIIIIFVGTGFYLQGYLEKKKIVDNSNFAPNE